MTPTDERYAIPDLDHERVEHFSQELGIPRIVAGILVLRGVESVDDAFRFLNPDLDRDWVDPTRIPGLQEAAERIERAVRGGERILVFGDFDTDGVTSTAIMMRTLHFLGADAEPLIPLRLEEGYGLTEEAIARIEERGPDLVITVDNGISASREVAMLLEHGIDVVVTDHHEPGESVPSGIPVADPKLEPGNPCHGLAGAGVALKLACLLGSLMDEPDLWRGLIDLAALGTLGDQMTLLGENRSLVAAGIRMMNETPSAAITAFQAKSGRTGEIAADGLTFTLIPRINSAGRMGDATVALDLLLSETQQEALACMDALERVNDERRAAEAACSDSALAQAERTYHGQRAIVLSSDEWHEGVKGIVASRVAHRYRVPAILFKTTPDGIAHGSGRSVGDVDLFHAVEESCSDILERFGGHSQAVGVTVQTDRLGEFSDRLCAYLETLPSEQFETRPHVDIEAGLDEVDMKLCEDIQLLAPFGNGNPQPVLITRNVLLEDRRKIGKPPAHFSCRVTDGRGWARGIWFRPPDLDALFECEHTVDVVYHLEINEFHGNRSPQLRLLDVSCGGRGSSDGGDAETAEFLDDLYARSDECLDTSDYAGILDATAFHTKVAGVSFEGRQDILKQLSVPCTLSLRREPDNGYDPNAVAVDAPEGQIGYLNARLSARLAPAIDGGRAYDAVLEQLTGGQEGQSLGANILVCRHDVTEDAGKMVEEFCDRRREWSSVPSDRLFEEVRTALIGNSELHEAQQRALALLSQGKNVLTVMATGRGKSLIFQMHAAMLALQCGLASVLVYPLRALVADQAYHLHRVFERFGLSVEVLTGESPEEERDRIFCGLADRSVDCVLTTPEFLTIHAGRFSSTGRIGFLVVDEAHHVATSGHRSAYGSLGGAIEALGNPSVLAVTATATDEVAQRICSDLRIDETVLDPTRRDNLELDDERDTRTRDALLAHIAGSGGKTVVYVNSREQSVQIARNLRKAIPQNASRIAFYNAGLSRADRNRIEQSFRDGRMSTIISTSAFGEGVNIPDIRNVVLYHLPFNAVEFNQMAGRAGRDGQEAYVHLLFTRRDARINEQVLGSSAPSREDMVLLYRVLRHRQKEAGSGERFQVTNAALAEECSDLDSRCRLVEAGVSSGIQVFKELGFLETGGHGLGRSIRVAENPARADLETSVRYCEGLDELAEFKTFRDWAFQATADELLARFDRPILPNSSR